MPFWLYICDETLNGPFSSREDAIEAGREEFGYDSHFTICEGDWQKYRGRIDIDWIREAFDEHNEELSGENPASHKWQHQDIVLLEALLKQTFEEWLLLKNYDAAWAIETRGDEVIEPVQSPPWSKPNEARRNR